ncbi:hypothetical protein [Microcoleus sp. AR_TQ3_B6]
MATRERVEPMAFYLVYMVGDKRGYIFNGDEYYLNDAPPDLLKFNN